MDRWATTERLRMHYLDHGGDGTPLVLLHGLSANARFFDAIVEDGLGGSIRVMAVDLRGRGLTDKPATGYSIDDHVADVIGLLDLLELDRVHIGGHSFGGLLTYHLAAHHPERVAKCIVLDAPDAITQTVVEQVKPSLKRLDATVPSIEVYLDAMRGQPYFEDWWDPRIEDYFRADVDESRDGSVRPRASSDTIGQAVEAASTTDWLGTIRRVLAPTLFIRTVGSYGPPGFPPICPADSAARTMDALPNGWLVEVQGNHMTAFYGENAQSVAEIIATFLLEES